MFENETDSILYFIKRVNRIVITIIFLSLRPLVSFWTASFTSIIIDICVVLSEFNLLVRILLLHTHMRYFVSMKSRISRFPVLAQKIDKIFFHGNIASYLLSSPPPWCPNKYADQDALWAMASIFLRALKNLFFCFIFISFLIFSKLFSLSIHYSFFFCTLLLKSFWKRKEKKQNT